MCEDQTKTKEKFPQAVTQRCVDSATIAATVLVIGQRSACHGRLKIIGTKLLCTIMATLDSLPCAIEHDIHSRYSLLKGMPVGRETCRTLLRLYSRCLPCRTRCRCSNQPLRMPLWIPRKRSTHRRVIPGVSSLRDNSGSEPSLARTKVSKVFSTSLSLRTLRQVTTTPQDQVEGTRQRFLYDLVVAHPVHLVTQRLL